MYYTTMTSPFGEIALTGTEHGLTALAFQQGDAAINLSELTHKPEIFTEAIEQLTQYFDGKRTAFSLKLAPQGTKFQQQVWQALCQIPYGETVSYAWLAEHINNPKAVRAVGNANGKNPIALIIPCHRVIGANNKLTGYAGGLTVKAQLLSFEGAKFTP